MDRVAPDDQIMPMARGASINLFGAAVTKVALLVITVLLSWALGAAALGRYAQAYALLTMLVAVATLPFGAGVTRFVAMNRVDGDTGSLRGSVRLTMVGTLVFSLLLGAVLYLFAGATAHSVFHDPGLVAPFRLVAIALPLASVAEAALNATIGYNRMRPQAVIKLVLEPAIRLALTIVLLLAGLGLTGAMVALVASSAIEAVLSVRVLRRYLGRIPAIPRYHARALFAFSLVAGSAWLATNGLVWADTLILGALRSSRDVGVYTVATRIVVLATFAMPAVTQAFQPRITDLYHRGRHAELRHAFNVVTGWNLVLSLPAFALLLAFPAELLGVFGHAFTGAVLVTMILVVGKIIDCATGPGAMMLTMSGRPGWALADNGGILALNILLNLVLIPPYGIIGAAVAWSVSLVVGNAARIAQVWLLMRMAPFELAQLRTVLAATLAGGCGLLVAAPFTGPVRLVVGTVVLGVTYLLAIALLQRRTEDRMVARMLVQQSLAMLRLRRQT